uniref:Uncharacterized protein n=1 Tax=mine drainage metagenome TaxID=410659 RepID=E6PM74_9ZZZZ
MNTTSTGLMPQPLRKLLSRLLPRRFQQLDRAAFSQAGVMDRRTIMLPMIGDQQGKSYYEVAEKWQRERLRAKKHLQEILDGTTDFGDPDHAASSFACEVGIWLRFVDLPGLAETLDDVRMWHDHWHQELARLIDLANEGRRLLVEESLKPGCGSWAYASRRVSLLLDALWVQKAPIALKLQRQGDAGAWIDAALLQEHEQGARLTVSLETRLPAGNQVTVLETAKPDSPQRAYRVKLCRPGQRGLQDEGVFIAYLEA